MPSAPPSPDLFEAEPDRADPRISRLLRATGPADAMLLGFPDDRGIVAGGGRAGAKEGPAALRAALREYGTTWNLASGDDLEQLRLVDGDDVAVRGGIEETHHAIADAVASALKIAEVVMAIGGGHDGTYGALLGMSRALPGPLGGVNVDAHLDVRPVRDGLVTSGTPFRRAIEDPRVGLSASRFTVLGADPRAGTRGSHAFLVDGGGGVVTRRQVARQGAAEALGEALARAGDGPLFVSFDLDVIAAAHAPGVSAPSPDGLSPREALDLVYEAGADSRVRYFDLVELSPPHDPQGLTARLAAALFVEFLHGLASRRRRAGRARTPMTHDSPRETKPQENADV